MARTARVVIPGLPHLVTQCGNNRQDVFFSDEDRERYLNLLSEQVAEYGVRLIAWCLMSNQVELVLVPSTTDGLEGAVGRTHWKYTQAINRLHGRSGHLWQGRFLSCPLDQPHGYAAVRHIERTPVRGRIVRLPERYPWSSAEAHCTGVDRRGLVDATRWSRSQPPETWRAALREPDDDRLVEALRRATSTGRPLASAAVIAKLEKQTGRTLRARPRGRPRKEPRE